MRKKTSKPDFLDRDVPSSLKELPRFAITRSRASSSELSGRSDIAFGIRSAEDLIKQMRGGFAEPEIEPPARRPKKR
jgi:hypothetical protein